jgi:hypothetical protein
MANGRAFGHWPCLSPDSVTLSILGLRRNDNMQSTMVLIMNIRDGR